MTSTYDNKACTKFDSLPFFVTPPEKRETRLGLITLATDLTIENEMRFFLGDRPISLLHSRIKSQDEVNPKNLKNMKDHFKESLSLFPPNHIFDVVGYGCTSGTLIIGEDEIEKIIKSHVKVNSVTTPLTAIKQASKLLEITKLGFLAPYNSQISQSMCHELESHNFNICAAMTFNEPLDSIVGCIDPESILEAIIELGTRNKSQKLDAIFVSCTALKCSSIITRAEAHLKIPILSSNSVLAWDMARLTGLLVNHKGKGLLFKLTNSNTNNRFAFLK